MSILAKTYQYRMYTPSGSFLGLLPFVTSEFNYNQNLFTTFAQMTVTVAQSADVGSLAVDTITDEAGNPITDESGNPLVIERQPDIVGNNNANAFMVNNNLIKVYEFSTFYPNGIKVFDGYISKTKTKYGTTDDIELTCLSQGTDMNNILVTSGDTAVTTQNSDDGSSFTSTDSGTGQWILQTFAVASAYQISAISLELTATVQANLQVSIKQQISTSPQPSSDPIVASGTVIVPIQTKTATKISFSQPTTLNPAYTYYIQIFWQDTSNITIFAKAGQPYGGGNVYTLGSSGTTFNTPSLQSGYSLYFTVWQYGGSVTGVYANEDPSLILTQVMTNYTSQGGLITPPVSTVNPLFSQNYGDSSIPGAYWSCAFAQTLTPAANITLDTIQMKVPQGTSNANFVANLSLYKGSPASDTLTVISGGGSYSTTNTPVTLPAITSISVNSNNGLATVVFATPFTLTAGQAYYFVWFFNQGQFTNAFQGASTVDPTISAPFGAVYSGLVLANNTSAGMSVVAGVQAMYMILGLGAGSNPNGGFPSTGTLASYTFKMQTVQQAIQAILSLAPANWYWYVNPATGELNFAQGNTVADVTLIKGRHLEDLDIESTKENIKNTAYFTGGDDGTGTSTNILTKSTATQGSNRKGLALLSDNRVNSTNGGTVTAKLIATNYLNQYANESYITNVTVVDQTIDINLLKLGQMIAISGLGNFVESLLLQVSGVNRGSDTLAMQLGSLPVRESQLISQINSQLSAQQTVANPSTPS